MCTSVNFVDKSGEYLYFGRNLDGSCSYGERVLVTPTGYETHSPFGAVQKINYPIIGMGIIQENTPLYFDCANSEGLAVAGLNFPGYAKYVDPNAKYIADEVDIKIAAYEFPLWVMQYKSVDEVEKGLWHASIVDKPINDKFPSSMLHWIIADKNSCIVVEQMGNIPIVYDNSFRVLVNQPDFTYHRENVKNYLNCTPQVPDPIGEAKAGGSGSGMRGLPGDYSSPSRFVRAEYLNRNYPPQESEADNVTRLFKTLGGVSMIDGAAEMLDGKCEKTIYTSGYSSKTNRYYYSTYDDSKIKSYNLDSVDVEGKELEFLWCRV